VNLESAKRLAAQTNRMVLIHFWADWCQPCKEMEQEVFSRPEVVAALETSFVPVRLNVDYFPHTRDQYGVTVLPTDIIITPQGQLVDRVAGTTDPPQYLARLSQVATAAGNRYAYDAGQPQQGPTAPAIPRYGGQAYSTQGGPGPAVEASRTPVPVYTAQRPDSAAANPLLTNQPASPYASGPVSSGFPQRDPTLTSQPPGGDARSPVAQLPPGNPPLGLDGYCPVQLGENERWVLGDRRWGLIHRGRTYLFASPEDRDRFNADPDRYAPVLSGNDVVLAVERGEMVPGRREHGGWFEGRVYLFSSEATFARFDANPYHYVSGLGQSASSTAGRQTDRTSMVDPPAPGPVAPNPYGRWR